MKTHVDEIGHCRRTMQVDVDWKEVEADYHRLIEGYAVQVAVPGFRKGKAPANIVERRFMRHMVEDAQERFVPKFYRAAIETEKVKPVAVVGVDDVSLARNEGLRFRVTFDVAPRFKLPKYQKIAVNKEEPNVTDEDVDAAIQSLRNRMARFEDIEGRAAAEGDLVRIDYSGTMDGKPLSEIDASCVGLGQATDFWAMLTAPDFLPGMPERIVGMSAGETRSVTVRFPEDFHAGAVAGREADYTVSLKAVRERVLPAIDAAFLAQIGVESEQALRERAKTELFDASVQQARNSMRGEISEFLLEKTPFDPPESLVERETRHVFLGMARSMMRQGMTHDELANRREQIGNQARQIATNRVRLQFVLLAIADEEKLELSDDEFDRFVADMAARTGRTPERLKAELQERDDMGGVRDDALCEKTMAHLMEMAKAK